MDPVDRVREEFDRAEVASRLGRATDAEALWPIEREALEGRLAPGALVLDLGCGEGREAAALLAQGARVVAGDLSQGMLDRARGALQGPSKAAAGRARLARLDARRLPFREGAFDAVLLTNMLLQYVWPRAGRVAAAREAGRVLAKDGIAIFHLFLFPLAEDLLGCDAPVPVRRALRLLFGAVVLFVNLLTDILRAIFRTRLEPGDRWSGHGVLAFYHMHSRAEMEREVREAGLVPVRWVCETPPSGGPLLSGIRERWNGQSAVLVASRAADAPGGIACPPPSPSR